MGPILNKYGFWDELTTEIAIANFGQEAFAQAAPAQPIWV